MFETELRHFEDKAGHSEETNSEQDKQVLQAFLTRQKTAEKVIMRNHLEENLKIVLNTISWKTLCGGKFLFKKNFLMQCFLMPPIFTGC